MLWLLTLIFMLVALQSASPSNDAPPDSEVQRQLQEMRSMMHQMKREVKSLREDNVSVKSKMQELKEENSRLETLITTGSTPRDIGRPVIDCTLGSSVRFDEFPDTYGVGPTYPIGAGFNAYQCLDICRQDPDCLAVSIGQDVNDCEGYSTLPVSLQSTDFWNFYLIIHTNSCLVDRPVIEFMAAISYSPCPDANELVVWDMNMFDSGKALHTDGKYYCPVAGEYKFTLSVRTYEGGSNGWSIRLNDTEWIASLYFDSADGDDVPGTVDVYSYCKTGESVSVWGEYTASCMVGDPSYVYSSFSGRLV